MGSRAPLITPVSYPKRSPPKVATSAITPRRRVCAPCPSGGSALARFGGSVVMLMRVFLSFMRGLVRHRLRDRTVFKRLLAWVYSRLVIFPAGYICSGEGEVSEKRDAFGRWENLVEPRQFVVVEPHTCGLRVCAYLVGGGCPGDHAGNGVLLFEPRDGCLNFRDP